MAGESLLSPDIKRLETWTIQGFPADQELLPLTRGRLRRPDYLFRKLQSRLTVTITDTLLTLLKW
jgi:hypothetical protein